MTVEPWVWWALALALCYALLRVAEWYMDLPPTESDRYCAQVDEELEAREHKHAEFDEQAWSQKWEDYMDERELVLMGRVLMPEIEAWLAARERYEGAT